MDELALKYGLNPNQTPASVFVESGRLPFRVLGGRPGYINLLDALNGWQLVRELTEASGGLPASASFKHVSPAGAALGLPMSETLLKVCRAPLDEALSPLACAYARARGADRMSSFGDFISLSHPCDVSTARLIAREVSDGVIAPGYDPEALAILQKKRKGSYTVLEIDASYRPEPVERKQVFGVTFQQKRSDAPIDETLLANVVTRQGNIPPEAQRDLLLALITLKYTQSNSVCYALDGQTVGVGAGQQSRIHCTRLAGDKADFFFLRAHPRVLELPFREGLTRPEKDNATDAYLRGESPDAFTQDVPPLTPAEKQAWLSRIHGVSLGSDAFFPFGDNILRAAASGVSYVAQPGGSIRDDDVIAACDRLGIAMAFTGLRLFHH